MRLGVDNLKSDKNITKQSVFENNGVKKDQQTKHKLETHEKETMNDEQKNIGGHRRF